MYRQWIQASGYLSIFLMPVLYFLGAQMERFWLAFGVVILIFPLARTVFGGLPASDAVEWRESVATALDRLPAAYVPVLIACVLVGTSAATEREAESAIAWVGLGLSLWMTLLFATCVAHELIHRRAKPYALLGGLLSGFCGYPLLGVEHMVHHGRPGDTDHGEAASEAESMWAFATRRLRRIVADLLGLRAPVWRLHCQSPSAVWMRGALASTAVTVFAFALIAGWRGVILYLAAVLGVSFGIQIITYVQHWALDRDAIGARVAYGRGWEDDCRFQAWITLAISLHDRHHQSTRQQFYRLGLAPDSPRLPAGYVILMFASMVPGVWRRIMQPALTRWLANPSTPPSAGRRLTCFGLHRP